MKPVTVLFFLLITLASCKKDPADGNGQPLAAQTLTNVSYGSDAKQKMDLYLPAGRSDTTKLIILVHGGAWAEGDKSDFNQFVPTLQQRLKGYAIANINYRLATISENHFPAQENDMKAAVDFLVSKAAEYHISQKFVILGASAGAHMALLQAYKYATPKIQAVVDFFGPTDMASFYNGTTNPGLQLALQVLLGGSPAANPVLYQQSSPLHFVNAQSPPTIILHGDVDEVVPLAQSTALQNKLQTVGVTHQLVVYPGLGHDIWPNDKMNDAFDKIEAFLKAHVH